MKKPESVRDYVLLGGSIVGAMGAMLGFGYGALSWLDRAFVSEAELAQAFETAERRDMLRFRIEAARDRISKMEDDDPDLARERSILEGLERELDRLGN